MNRHGVAENAVTDRLVSCRAVLRELGSKEKQQTGSWLHNRVENSHLPYRRRQSACRYLNLSICVGLVLRARLIKSGKGQRVFFDLEQSRKVCHVHPPAMRAIELGDKADIGEGWGVCETEPSTVGQHCLIGGKPLGHPMVEPSGLTGRVYSHLRFEGGHDPQVFIGWMSMAMVRAAAWTRARSRGWVGSSRGSGAMASR